MDFSRRRNQFRQGTVDGSLESHNNENVVNEDESSDGFLEFDDDGILINEEESFHESSESDDEKIVNENARLQQKLKTPYVLDHCINFFTKVNEFSIAGKYTDVNIKCRTEVFKCHRVILASASEYFDIMFCASFKEKNTTEIELQDIEPAAFKEIVSFAYGRDVHIDEENVTDLLYASEVLLLESIVNRCIEFLCQRCVPVDRAIDLFLLANVTKRSVLISHVGKFILENLKYFAECNNFLEIPHEDFATLLSYFEPSAPDESELARAVFRWTSHQYTNSCDLSPEAAFIKYTQKILFQLKTAKEYYQYAKSCETTFGSRPLQPHYPVISSCRKPQYSLEVFINTADEQTVLFTLQKSDKLEWCEHKTKRPFYYDFMQSVPFAGSLYSYIINYSPSEMKYRSGLYRHDMNNFPTTMSLLQFVPSAKYFSCNDVIEFSYLSSLICSDKNNIYVVQLPDNGRRLLVYYDYCLQKILPFPVNVKDPIPLESKMVSLDSRLYLIGDWMSYRQVRAYDFRDRNWNILTNYQRSDGTRVKECCVHKGKIYQSFESSRGSRCMLTYDPVAGKWDNAVKLNKIDPSKPHRLVSYDNLLWLIGSDEAGDFCSEMYDSFLNQSSFSYSLNDTFSREERVYSRRSRAPTILNAVVSKSYP